MESPQHLIKTSVDITSATVAFGALLKLLPPLAAILSVCWYSVLFYDRFIRKRDKKP